MNHKLPPKQSFNHDFYYIFFMAAACDGHFLSFSSLGLSPALTMEVKLLIFVVSMESGVYGRGRCEPGKVRLFSVRSDGAQTTLYGQGCMEREVKGTGMGDRYVCVIVGEWKYREAGLEIQLRVQVCIGKFGGQM